MFDLPASPPEALPLRRTVLGGRTNRMGGHMNRTRMLRGIPGALAGAAALVLALSQPTSAQDVTVVKADSQIDAFDAGIKLFIREKMAQGNTRFTDDNIVLFLHGATSPSTCDFDLAYKDYSWADWLVNKGYVVYMGDYRNYGGSTREPGMDEPAAKNPPLSRSYLALRDVEAMVNAIKAKRGVKRVTLIGWSWGAMMAGYYSSLHPENVSKLILYAPLYNFNDHTNLGPGSALQNKRKPYEFNFALGAYRLASEAIPVPHRAYERRTACSRIPFTKPQGGHCGMPRTSTWLDRLPGTHSRMRRVQPG